MKLTNPLGVVLLTSVALLCAGCPDDPGLDQDAYVQLDAGDSRPLPWFREAGCGGDLGQCRDGGDAGQDLAGADLPVADQLVPDLPAPDQCVAPTSCAVTFSLAKGSEKKAEFAGDITSWKETPMTLNGATWEYKVTLKQAQQVQYKFVVDGKWINDPKNPKVTPDQYKNSLLVVTCPNPCGG